MGLFVCDVAAGRDEIKVGDQVCHYRCHLAEHHSLYSKVIVQYAKQLLVTGHILTIFFKWPLMTNEPLVGHRLHCFYYM